MLRDVDNKLLAPPTLLLTPLPLPLPPPRLPLDDEFELEAFAPFADDDERTTLCGELPRRTTLACDCCGEFWVTMTNFCGG